MHRGLCGRRIIIRYGGKTVDATIQDGVSSAVHLTLLYVY